MTATTPPAPPTPSAPATPEAPEHTTADQHFACGVLQLYRFCSLARCRRIGGCHGEPQRCLATHGWAAPVEARVAAEALLDAARYNHVSPGEGDRWFRQEYRREMAALNAWIATLESRDRRKEGYRLKARFRRTGKRKANIP
jgi:hypothetical protein